jgi:hypothetical protein
MHRLRLVLLLAETALAFGCAGAGVEAELAAIDPVLARGFAALSQNTGLTVQPPDDAQTAWRPGLQLWVGVKATAGKNQTVYFVQLTTLAPPPTNVSGQAWAPTLRTNHWSWPAATNKNAALRQADYLLPLYPVRARVFDATGHPRKEGQTPMAWGMLTNGLLDMCRLGFELFPHAANSNAAPAFDHLSTADNDRLMRAVGGGFLWMLQMFGDLQTVPAVADVWKEAQCAVRMPGAWTLISGVFTGVVIELEPRLDHVTLTAPASTAGPSPLYLLPVDLRSDRKLLSRVQIRVGPAHGAEMLLAGIRSIRAVHPTKPQHEFLAQVLAAGSTPAQ